LSEKSVNGISEIEFLNAQLKINKLEIFGPVRIFLNDQVQTSVSIQSFNEL
jgi:hypothetical protein